jgi:cytochrome P450
MSYIKIRVGKDVEMEEHTLPLGRDVIEFDKKSPQHAKSWEEEYRAMRTGCPVAWTESSGGYWVTSRYADVSRIAGDYETFSSAKHYDPEAGIVTGGLMIPPVPKAGALPIESDPPEWKTYRDILNPFFGPRRAESWRSWTSALADRLLDSAVAKGRLDIVHDYTSPIPTLLTLEILGLKVDDWQKFVKPCML